MSEKNNAAAEQSEEVLVITRIFDAPPGLVFKAWTQPEHLAHWCYPRAFTTPFHKSDIRPGGKWRVCMRSPEGKDYWVQGVYREILEPERIVFTHAWEDAEGKPGHDAGDGEPRRAPRQDEAHLPSSDIRVDRRSRFA